MSASVPGRIGRYRIVRVLGEGGMGAVYLAEQESPRRPVALKLVRAGMASDEVVGRFRFEAEVLGRLRHPGIAQVYEAGTVRTDAGELPFFAMELVDGVTLDRHLAERHPDHDTRLALIASVCDAVNHAHQQGVIHRDLKPANILVDGEGRPKVVDFGVARVLGGERNSLLETQAGQIVGTLAYMSPEQVGGDPAAVDTRSDVYALGVILFETMSGRHPFPLTGKGLTEAVRMLSEHEAPRLGAALPGVDEDLEVIVGKALAHERERRYASAGELAEDLRRLLRDEPITARPPTTAYQLRKLTHRHRAAVLGVFFTALAVLAGLAVSIVLFLRERDALGREHAALGREREALVAERRARAEVEHGYRVTSEVVDFLGGMLGMPGDEASAGDERVTLLSALLRGEGLLTEEDEGLDPESRARIHGILGSSLLALDEPEAAERNLAAGLASPASVGATRVEALLGLATLRARRGACDTSRETADEALAVARGDPGPRSETLVRALVQSGSLARICLDLDTARARADEVLRIVTDAADASDAPGRTLILHRSRALRLLGEVASEEARPADARDLLVASLAAFDASGAEPSLEYAQTLGELAGVAATLGDRAALGLSEQSLQLTRRVRGNLASDTAAALSNHAVMLAVLGGDPGKAREALEESIEIDRALFPEGTPSLVKRLANLADLCLAAGRLDEALDAAQQALAVGERVLGEQHPDLAMVLMTIGRIREARGENDEVLALQQRALAINRAALGDDHRHTILQLGLVGRAAWIAGDLAECVAACREGFERASRAGSSAADLVPDLRDMLLRALRRQGDAASLAEADALEAARPEAGDAG